MIRGPKSPGVAQPVPPQDSDIIILPGGSQARDLTAGATAVERVAPVGPDHLDAAAWPGVGGDPLAHRIGAGHRDDLLWHGPLRSNRSEESVCHAGVPPAVFGTPD